VSQFESLVQPLEFPMLMSFGRLRFDAGPTYPFLPGQAREAAYAEGEYSGVLCTAQLAADPYGKLKLGLSYEGRDAVSFDEDSPAFSNHSGLMSSGPHVLTRYMSWLKGNIVFVVSSPDSLDHLAPVFIGPEFEAQDGGVFGLDDPEFHYNVMPFINGRAKPRATRKVLYLAWGYVREPHTHPRRVLGLVPNASEVLCRHIGHNGQRYVPRETRVRFHNFGDFGVIVDRLLELGEVTL